MYRLSIEGQGDSFKPIMDVMKIGEGYLEEFVTAVWDFFKVLIECFDDVEMSEGSGELRLIDLSEISSGGLVKVNKRGFESD